MGTLGSPLPLVGQMEPEPELADDAWVGVEKKFVGGLKEWEHSLPVEVFISDTDSYAIIYHTVYHKYFERARVEFLGVAELMRLRREDGVLLRELETRHIRFFDSGLLGDLCTVVTKLVELDGSRIVMEHRFLRDRDKKMLTRGVCELGFLDVSTGALVPIPPTILRGLAADTAQHIPRNAISSIFGGGAQLTPTSYRTLQPAHPHRHTICKLSDEENIPWLENPLPNTTKVVADPTRNLNTELFHPSSKPRYRRCTPFFSVLTRSVMRCAAYNCSAPKPYDWLSNKVAPYVWKTTCYGVYRLRARVCVCMCTCVFARAPGCAPGRPRGSGGRCQSSSDV